MSFVTYTANITATNNSTAVTGAGTTFVADGARVGDILYFIETSGPVGYPIAAVPSSTSITLSTPYRGTTGGSKTAILMRRYDQEAAADTYRLLNTFVSQLNQPVIADLLTRWIAASASGPASLDFAEDTDNGVNRLRLTAPASIALDGTVTLPAAGGTLATIEEVTSGYRNAIINGAFDHWQRGTSLAGTGYLADRFRCLNVTSQSRSTDVPTGFEYSIEFANTAATFPLVEQMIEAANARQFVGETVTVSAWVKNVAGAATLYADLNHANAKDNFSAVTSIGIGATIASPSAAWTRYTWTFANLPAGAANGLSVRIIRGNGAPCTTRVTGVQIERGSVATKFEQRSIATELELCQRYFYNHINGATQMVGAGGYITATQVECFVPFPTAMRVAPTLVQTTGTDFYLSNTTDGFNSFTINRPSQNGCLLFNNTEATGTAGQYARISSQNAAARISFDAEL